MKNDKFSINLTQFDDMSSLSSRHTSATYIKKRTDQSETSLISSSSKSSDISNEKESLLSEYDEDYDINKIYLHLKNLKKTTTTITKSDSIHIDYDTLLTITINFIFIIFIFYFFIILPIFYFFISHNKLIVFNFI